MVSKIEMFNDANILQSMVPKHFKKNVQKESVLQAKLML